MKFLQREKAPLHWFRPAKPCRIRALACALLVVTLCSSSFAGEIYFAPRSPKPNQIAPVDWQSLFDSPAWSQVATQTRVFQFDENYFPNVEDQVLKSIGESLKKRHIKVAIGTQPLALLPGDKCGHGVEGFNDLRIIVANVRKLKSAGIELDYLAMDGALWFGHYFTGPNACHLNIDEVARRAAVMANEYLKAYPNLVIGDVEGVPTLTSQQGWQAVYRQWKLGFESITDHKIAFLGLDMAWRNPAWPEHLKLVDGFVHQLGMQLGIIFNGDNLDRSDLEWVDHAAANFTEVESKVGVIPDLAIFAGWNDYPTHLLPETSPATMTNLINRYLRPRTNLVVKQSNGVVHGFLKDQTDRPIFGAEIRIERSGFDRAQPLPERVVSGSVPVAAKFAVLGIRINAECNCSGSNDFYLGELAYRESAGGHAEKLASPSEMTKSHGVPFTASVVPGLVGGRKVVHVEAGANQTLIYNSAPFAVTAAAHFDFKVPVASATENGLFGNIAIIWLDADRKGLYRTNMSVDGQYSLLTAVTTNEEGGFFWRRPTQAKGETSLKISFSGNEKFRPAITIVRGD